MPRFWITAPLMICTLALAKLPAPDDAAKAKAAEAAAKSAWSSKATAYKLCLAQDNAARNYRQNKGASTTVAPVQPLPACVDPGPFVSAQSSGTNKELEAAGAHSPPATAGSPPGSPERKDPVDKGKAAVGAGKLDPASAENASKFSISPGSDHSSAQAVPLPVPVLPVPAPVPLKVVPARATTASPAVPIGELAPRN